MLRKAFSASHIIRTIIIIFCLRIVDRFVLGKLFLEADDGTYKCTKMIPTQCSVCIAILFLLISSNPGVIKS